MCAVMFVSEVSEGAVSAKLLAQLLWGPLPDVLPTPEWRLSPPPDDPAMASDADTDPEAGKALVDRRVRAGSVQAVVRKAYLGILAEQERIDGLRLPLLRHGEPTWSACWLRRVSAHPAVRL